VTIIKFIITIVVWLYVVIFMLWIQLLGLLFRLLSNPEDLLFAFNVTLLLNQIKEIYASIPGIDFASNFYRRL
jgi:hypothetical protein